MRALFLFSWLLLLSSTPVSLAKSVGLPTRELSAAVQKQIKKAIMSDEVVSLLGLFKEHSLAANTVIQGDDGMLWSPLRFSVLNGQVSIVKHFVETGEYLDDRVYPSSGSLRHVAEALGYEEIAELIWEAKAGGDTTSADEITPVVQVSDDPVRDNYIDAAKNGDIAMVRDYLENWHQEFFMLSSDLMPTAILMAAVEGKQRKLVEYLLDFSEESETEYFTALFADDELEEAADLAGELRHLAIKKMLIEHRQWLSSR